MKRKMSVGIDLGSTYSAVSEYNADNNSVDALTTDAAAPPSIPSVVCIDVDSKEVFTGVSAKEYMGEEGYSVYEAFKMLLIENDPHALAQYGYTKEVSPRKITTLFLRNTLMSIKQRHMTTDGYFETVYICVPEIWCSEMRNLGALDGKAILREILLQDTGLPIKEVCVVTEPEAASAFFAWNYERETETAFNGHLLLIDYGGGTLDLTLTEVISSRGGAMEIAYREGGGAGENHKDANGRLRVGSAGLQYMRTVLCYAIADTEGLGKSCVPDFTSNDFTKAFKNLERAFKDPQKADFIQNTFDSYGNFRNIGKILNDPPLVFFKLRFRGKSVDVTMQHLYRAYHDTIEEVLDKQLAEINAKIKQKLRLDPCQPEAGNNDNFKIALVGGFGSFYLVRKQVDKVYHFMPDNDKDKRIKSIIIDKRELAIPNGAALLAAKKVVQQKTARYSIGIVSRQTGTGELKLRYGIKCHQKLKDNTPYFLLRDDTAEDNKNNRINYGGGLRNNLSYFAIESSERTDHGWLLAIKRELLDKLSIIPDNEGIIWNIGFSIDLKDVISMHIEDVAGNRKPIKIELESYANLFELADAIEIQKNKKTGQWETRL